MNILRLKLSPVFDSVAPHCKITCCGEQLFDDVISKNLDLEYKLGHFTKFHLEIEKTGKTLEVVNNRHEQIVNIENVNLNGIDLKAREFGEFEIRANPYVEDARIKTDHLHLNGVWSLTLPERHLEGDVDLDNIKLRDEFMDCEIACFGCSQTYGKGLEKNETWPAHLQDLTGKVVRNYGVIGSNINEIKSLVEHFNKNYTADMILIYLPHTFRRQILKEGKVKQVMTLDQENKDLILHGEEHSVAVLADQFKEWIDSIHGTKLYFGTYQRSENKLFEKTALKKYMMPFLRSDDYPKASDGVHNGSEFNQVFAKNIKDFYKLG